MDNTEIIILAAGKGTRMQSELPKALTPLQEKPFLLHVLEAANAAGFAKLPIAVVGTGKDLVMQTIGPKARYAIQTEMLGTGHAVLAAKDIVSSDTDTVFVLYADHPLVTPQTMQKIVKARKDTGATVVIATVVVPDFSDWRQNFLKFGRIIRDGAGKLTRILEYKDATDTEREIKEINPGYYAFDAKWLFDRLPKLQNMNAAKEYYLTDLVSMAFAEGLAITTVAIDARDALGANSKEELAVLERVLNGEVK